MKLTCLVCEKEYDSEDIYSYYCSNKCEKRDDQRINRELEKGRHPFDVAFGDGRDKRLVIKCSDSPKNINSKPETW